MQVDAAEAALAGDERTRRRRRCPAGREKLVCDPTSPRCPCDQKSSCPPAWPLKSDPTAPRLDGPRPVSVRQFDQLTTLPFAAASAVGSPLEGSVTVMEAATRVPPPGLGMTWTWPPTALMRSTCSAARHRRWCERDRSHDRVAHLEVELVIATCNRIATRASGPACLDAYRVASRPQ
jgi:hypothetical protein